MVMAKSRIGNPHVFLSGSKKRAQFFLLAAVIISAVIISLGFVGNKATVNREPGSFYDFSYEVKRETGSVIDYEIYTISDGNLTDFIDLLSDDIRDRDPDADFLFIFGDNETMKIQNEGTGEVAVGDQMLEGAGAIVISKVCPTRDTCTTVNEERATFNDGSGTTTLDVSDLEDFVVSIGDNDFIFPVSEHRQVIFIIQKETEDETFVSVE